MLLTYVHGSIYRRQACLLSQKTSVSLSAYNKLLQVLIVTIQLVLFCLNPKHHRWHAYLHCNNETTKLCFLNSNDLNINDLNSSYQSHPMQVCSFSLHDTAQMPQSLQRTTSMQQPSHHDLYAMMQTVGTAVQLFEAAQLAL